MKQDLRRRSWLVLFLACTWSQAQAAGEFLVQVVDPTGGSVSGALVRLEHETGIVPPRTATAGPDGTAFFFALPSSEGYSVVATSGTLEARQSALRLPAGSRVRVVLSLGQADEGPGSRRPIAVDETSARPVLAREALERLPFAGDASGQLLALTPGAHLPDPASPNLHGSRGRDVQVVVDGVPQGRDPLTTRFSSFVPSSSQGRLVAVHSGAGVQYGQAQGGFIDVSPPEGTNEFRGTLGLLYRTHEFDGSGVGAGVLGEPDFESVDSSIALSGPLLRDRLWLRLAWQRADREDPVNVTRGIVVQPVEREAHAHRLTLQASPRNRLGLQYRSDSTDVDRFGIDSLVGPGSAPRLETENETASIHWTASASPRVLVETAVAFQRTDGRIGRAAGATANGCIPSLTSAFCLREDSSVSGPHYLTATSENDRLWISSKATASARFWGAAHRFTFGLQIANERFSRFEQRRPIIRQIDPSSVDLTVAVPQISSAPATSANYAAYFEDRIKPTNHLALTLGLRIDRQELESLGFAPFDPRLENATYTAALEQGVPPQVALTESFTVYEALDPLVEELSETLGLPESAIISRLSNELRQSAFLTARRPGELNLRFDDLSPSISIAWDPTRDGKTRIGASGRRYMDRVFPTDLLIDGGPATVDVPLRVSPSTGSISGFRSPIVSVSTTIVDHTLETPYQDEWRLFFTRDLGAETSLHVAYVQRDYRHQRQETDINNVPGDMGRCRVATPANPAAFVPSPGEGTLLTDPFTGEEYTDTDPGNGDGRVDDCSGTLEFTGPYGVQRPDGLPDPYVQNVFWGRVFHVSDDNASDYEAFVVELLRRQHRGWGFSASYVWAESESRAENYERFLSADPTKLANTPGRQSNHQEHTVRLAVNSALPRGFTVGALLNWGSGLPYSTVRREAPLAVLPNFFSPQRTLPTLLYSAGRRNSFDNASQWLFDFRVAKGFDLGARMHAQLSLEIFNAFDDDTYKIYNPDLGLGLQVDGVPRARQEFGRRWQLGGKLQF